MQNTTNHDPAPLSDNDVMPTDGNLIPWIASQVKKQGPVFRVPSVRPTYVLSGRDALAMMDDPALTERTRAVNPVELDLVLNDDRTDTITMTNGEEHQRRRSSWLTPGGLDQAGISRVLPGLEQTIDATLNLWEKRQFFSVNLEVRRACWRIANRLILGQEGDERNLLDFEILMAGKDYSPRIKAKGRILDWLGEVADQYGESNNPEFEACVAAKLAASGHLSRAELINEMNHGLAPALGMCYAVAEVLHRFAIDGKLSGVLRAEVNALEGDFQTSGQGRTPVLSNLVQEVLRFTTPAPLIFTRARVSFNIGDVTIPENAVLIGALHGTNQLPEEQKATPGRSNLAFGFGSHACPAADMATAIIWLFAVKVIASFDLQKLDPDDLPVQQAQGYFSPRGFFVKCSRTERNSAPLNPVPIERAGSTASSQAVDPTARVAVVGGGITGLTLAHELRKAGFQNVTVLERAPSIGGKADTITIDGRPYNLGAHLCHGELGVAALAKEVGVALERTPTYELWDIERNQVINRSYEHYDQVNKLRELLARHPELEQASGFAAMESWTYPSVLSWLDANNLSGLRDIGPFFTGAGYGFLKDDVPAAFFLKFAQHMTEDGWTPAGGYKHLLEIVAKGLDVRCNTEVNEIKREPSGAHPIQVLTRTAGQEPERHVFDKLILAGPLNHAAQYLNLNEEEQALFSRIKALDYYTIIATLDIEQAHEPGLYIVPENTVTSAKKGRTTAFERAFEESKVYHFFFYGEPGQSDQSILENIRDDARKLGGEIADIHVFRKWSYAPHVSPHDMALGFHKRLEQLQGHQGTYYAGSLLAFELTDHNVLQAKSLIERFFKDKPVERATISPDVSRASVSRLPETGTQSILEILKEHYERTPERVFTTFLDSKGEVLRALTYKTLVEHATAIALSLRDRGLKSGDRVALVYPPNTDEFMVGFFGCLLIRAIAIPVAAPDPRKLKVEAPRFIHMMNDCDCHFALTTRLYSRIALSGKNKEQLTNLDSGNEVQWINTDGLSPVRPSEDMSIPSPTSDTLAYLQYTSGSTSEPKGVMISHGNVLHNVEAICVQAGVDENSILTGWVPLFHDMGLVGGPLTTLYAGAQLVYFSPMSFLQNPLLWIKSMHKYRVTHTESPNFGYDFLLERLNDESLEGIDLSCLTHVLFGGEVMRPTTFEKLAERLYGTGFRAQAMTNIFGAAEATLFLAGGGMEPPPLLSVSTGSLELERRAVPLSPDLRSTTTLIGCRIPPVNCDLRIVDPESNRLLPEREVGEIWLSSPSVSQGYWGRAEQQNALTFRARVADDPEPLLTYLRTGDLGFIEKNVLYICGRLKEMMIFSGRNIHPMDIELSVTNAHPAIRQGNVAAFSVEEDGLERLIIVAEFKAGAKNDPAEAAEAMAHITVEQHQLGCKAIVLVRIGSLSKTSSGKLQRFRARENFLADSLERIYTLEPEQAANSILHSNETEDAPDLLDEEKFTGDVFTTRNWLQRLVALSLHAAPDEVDTSTSLSQFGVNSAQAISMATRISSYLGTKLPPSILYEHPTLDTLSLFLCSNSSGKKRPLIQLQRGAQDGPPNLFCVHPAGGNAMVYLGLVELLPDPIPVYVFGNESSDVPTDNLVAMASTYVDEMRNIQGEGPYHLLGYSFGGTVVFEMARQILAAGGEIGGLFLIDSPAPIYLEKERGPGLTEAGTYSNLLEVATLNHLIPDSLDDKEREALHQRIDQNLRALSAYRITEGGVRPNFIMFRASEKSPYLRESAEHPGYNRPDFGWEEASPGSVLEVVKVPGDHFSVMFKPFELAELLVSRMRQGVS